MCLSPLTIKVSDYRGNRTIQVPCGKCVECLKTKQNDYMVRIVEEMQQAGKSCFVTLTYSNDTVPYIEREGKRFNVVWKDDIKDWIKRFRTNYERKTGKKGIRYFLCSEYGPKTHRPHYHAIFFGLSKCDMQLALDDWTSRFGFVLAKDVDYLNTDISVVARYVAKYAVKGIFEDPFCCSPKPSEAFQAFLKRIRRDLYIPNGCFPHLFYVSSLSTPLRSAHFLESPLDPYALTYNYSGLRIDPRFQKEVLRFVFGRGLAKEMCNDPWN